MFNFVFYTNLKDSIDLIIYCRNNRECIIHRCNNCPGTGPLKTFLQEKLINNNGELEDGSESKDREENEIQFSQWVSVDRTDLNKQCLPVNEFIDLLIEKADKLIPH